NSISANQLTTNQPTTHQSPVMTKPTTSHGWHMPAEWEPHAATWIAWPHNRDDWPGKFSAIPWVYGEIVRHLHTGEAVNILVNDASLERRARGVLAKSKIDMAYVL